MKQAVQLVPLLHKEILQTFVCAMMVFIIKLEIYNVNVKKIIYFILEE
jgi:hypothetical protein